MKVNGLTTTKISERLSVLLTLDFGRSGRDTPASGSWSIRDDRDLHNSMPRKSSLSLHRDGLVGFELVEMHECFGKQCLVQ